MLEFIYLFRNSYGYVYGAVSLEILSQFYRPRYSEIGN